MNIINEMAYPSSFNMETFKSIPSFAGRIRYCTEKLGKSIGVGSSRRVFKIDGEKVIKLAINRKGIAQNEAECDWFLAKIGLFAKVYDVDDDYRWIEMQLARKAKASDFKKFFGYSFDVICNYIDYTHSQYTTKKSFFRRNDSYDEMFDEIRDSDKYYDTVFYMIDNYLTNTSLEAIGDLKRISSWGVVRENGVERLVLVDYGLNDSVSSEFYNINENDIKNMVKQVIIKLKDVI